ncbi:hypothetical protein VULLAG_LOCUS18026 [Vulpes lagopus]
MPILPMGRFSEPWGPAGEPGLCFSSPLLCLAAGLGLASPLDTEGSLGGPQASIWGALLRLRPGCSPNKGKSIQGTVSGPPFPNHGPGAEVASSASALFFPEPSFLHKKAHVAPRGTRAAGARPAFQEQEQSWGCQSRQS